MLMTRENKKDEDCEHAEDDDTALEEIGDGKPEQREWQCRIDR